jgi:hypothetical protein
MMMMMIRMEKGSTKMVAEVARAEVVMAEMVRAEVVRAHLEVRGRPRQTALHPPLH